MNRIRITRALAWGFAFLVLAGCMTAVAVAQTKTTVESGTGVAVSGNNFVVKDDNTGQLRNFTAPPGATAMVDGKQITVADLKPGMRLQRTTITTTTHRTVTSMRTVNGVVTQVNAPYVTFRRSDGEMKRVKVPNGTPFMIDGQKKTVFDLRPGTKFTATVVTEAPEVVVTSKRNTTGSGAPEPAPKPVIASVPAKIEETVLIEEAPAPKPVQMAEAAPAPAPEPKPAKLPKTGTPIVFIGIVGLSMSLAGLKMRLARRR